MTPKEIQAKADAIRALISDNDLELANEKLVELTKLSLEDHWDEALTISANREKLERELRSGFLNSSEAEAKRNRLIDRMLELTRAIEKGKIIPTPIPPNKDEKKQNLWWIWPLMGTILVAGLLFFYLQNDAPVEDNSSANTCEQLLEEGKDQFGNATLEAAYETFVALRKTCPDMQSEANKWLQIVAKEQAKSRPQTPEEDADSPRISEEEQAENRTQTKKEAYARFMNAGDEASSKKQYEQALAHYQEARKIDDTMEAARGEQECIEKLYRDWFSKGMDKWNAQDYKAALSLFEKAQGYKDFSQVQAMIKKCKRKI